MHDAQQGHAAEIARLGESVRHLEVRVQDGSEAIREGLAAITESVSAMREDLREDMREIRDGMAEDVKAIARNVANLHNRLQDPESGIIRIVDDHERRLKALEAIHAAVVKGTRKMLWWVLFGVCAFLGAALVRYAPQIGQWIADVNTPTAPGEK